MPAPPVLLALSAVLVAGQAGCVQVTVGSQGIGVVRERSVTWTWADWNTLGRPAWFVERIEHLPPEADRVRYYRWLHGAGVSDPIAAPLQTTTFAEIPGTAVVLEPPLIETVEPPTSVEEVPLPEPTPTETAPLPPEVMAVPDLPTTLVSGEQES
jgi:hypothetical protein